MNITAINSDLVLQNQTDILQFHKVGFRHILDLKSAFKEYRSYSCDYSLGGLLIWKDYYDYQIAEHEGLLYFKGRDPQTDVELYYLPIGKKLPRKIYNFLRAETNRPGKAIVGYRISEMDSSGDSSGSGLIGIDSMAKPEWDDYIYDIKQFLRFEGKKMAKKRNHLNYFNNHFPDAEISAITPADIPGITAFTRGLDSMHSSEPLFMYENMHCTDMLPYFDICEMIGIVIRYSGKIIGYTYGEAIGEMFFDHVEKGDISYPGVYQALASSLARMVHSRFPDVKFINREDDAGNEALRKSKLSYHPVAMIHKRLIIDSGF